MEEQRKGNCLGHGEKAENRWQLAHSNEVECVRVKGAQKQQTLKERQGNDPGGQGGRWGWGDRLACPGKKEGLWGGEVNVCRSLEERRSRETTCQV